MKKQFTLSSIGVQEWVAYIYAGGARRIDEECTYIAHDFVEWIRYRFTLSSDQVTFLISLGPLVHESYSTDIQNTLQLRGPISLDKEEAPVRNDNIENAKAQNPKVVWKEKQNAVAEQSTADVQQDYKQQQQGAKLLFRITYPDINAN